MSSGIDVDQECIERFEEMKKNKHRYVIFKLNDKMTQVVVDKVAPGFADVTYEDCIANFNNDSCRYAAAILDYEQQSQTGQDEGSRSKVVFFQWAPDTAPTKQKMVYASTKDAIKKKLNGIQIEIQGTEKPEVEKEYVIAKCRTVSK